MSQRWRDADAVRRPMADTHVVLRDGTRVVVRPIRPADRPRLVKAMALLSARSRYLRFQGIVDHLTDDQLRYFTNVDHHDHEAWIAIDEDRPEIPGAGVAQYVRLAEESQVAEAALTVADHYQGRGLGTVLMAVLARSAIANGIVTFRNYVLADNEVMLEVFQQLGADMTEEPFGIYRVDFSLPTDLTTLPRTPAGDTLREVGANLGLDPPLWISNHSGAPPTPHRSSGHERGELRDWLDLTMPHND